MNIESINYAVIIYSILCIVLGIIISWIYMKKTVLAQSVEIKNIIEDFNLLQQKYEILQMEKIEIDKQFAVLTKEAQRIPEIEENLEMQLYCYLLNLQYFYLD